MSAYYNENNKQAAAWLRELIRDGLIADGEVDQRSIAEVSPGDIAHFTQCHFFAGIGGWSLALRLAGWPDDRPVWTGSCPCQDFSLSGKQAGFAGARDLWPIFRNLIRERAPYFVFGEQVDDSPEWIERTASDLESLGYAFAPVVIPACSVNSLQERARLLFVAHSASQHGDAYDRLGKSGAAGASPQSRGFPCLHVAGTGWHTGAGSECLPILVRSFDGLSGILGGFGNAIVPQVAAEFIQAALEAGLP